MTIVDRCLASVVVALAIAGAAAPAYAQSVDAEVLFREGKRLLGEGHIAEACDKFDASARIESSAGTLLNLADCRERNHQTATAWEAFLRASAVARTAGNDPKREAEGRRRAALLEPRLSYVTIVVPASVRVAGLTIKRAGKVVDPALWGQGVPLDPGSYPVEASAPGLRPWTATVDVTKEGQKISVEVATLRPIAEPAPPRTPTPTPTPADPRPSEPAIRLDRSAGADHPVTRSRWTTAREVAVGGAAVGVAGIVVGAVFGGKANDLERQANVACPQAACGDLHALQLNHDAQSDATIANVAIIGGSALVAGAVVLWILRGPKTVETSAFVPSVGHDQVGFVFARRF